MWQMRLVAKRHRASIGACLGVELASRGLQNFSISNPSIMETVKLPNWEHSDHIAWPPPKNAPRRVSRSGDDAAA
jgi:hypothetical protein